MAAEERRLRLTSGLHLPLHTHEPAHSLHLDIWTQGTQIHKQSQKAMMNKVGDNVLPGIVDIVGSDLKCHIFVYMARKYIDFICVLRVVTLSSYRKLITGPPLVLKSMDAQVPHVKWCDICKEPALHSTL